jgi:hypothetical protein
MPDKGTRRTCAFCGEEFGPDRKRSGEHAWAKSFASLLPHPGGDFTHTIRLGLTGEVTATWDNKDLDIVAKQVCKPCNEGWMEALDTKAAPYLRAMQKPPRSLYNGEQRILAAWATKTSLALHLATPGLKPIDAGHYRNMTREKDQPPQRSQVWTGAYQGHRLAFHEPKALRLDPAHQLDDAYQGTIVFGRAVFQVFWHSHQNEVLIAKEGARAHMTTQIWPIREFVVRWPPEIIVTDESMPVLLGGWGVEN